MSSGDRLAAVASGFVGALALAVSFYNVYLQRAQIRAEVWPHLEWSYSNLEGYDIKLENTGAGPAIVRGARATVDGKPVKSWSAALEAIGGTDPAFQAVVEKAQKGDVGMVHSFFSGSVLSAGAAVHPLAFSPLSTEENKTIVAGFKRLSVDICYCSTLEDCWMAHRFASRPVSACQESALDFVE